eukprot:scaffold253509_cov19-Prasinocladus_malaysianus.AAC.1
MPVRLSLCPFVLFSELTYFRFCSLEASCLYKLGLALYGNIQHNWHKVHIIAIAKKIVATARRSLLNQLKTQNREILIRSSDHDRVIFIEANLLLLLCNSAAATALLPTTYWEPAIYTLISSSCR